MKGTKMILLVICFCLSMFFLQGYGSADDSSIRAGKMQKMEESTMMQNDADMNKAKTAMKGSMKNDMDKSLDSDMKKPMGMAMEQPEQNEMNKMITVTKDASMQEEMK